MILPIYDRLETGRKFFMFSLSRDDFFISGLTIAFLCGAGIKFSVRDLLTIVWIVGSRVGRTSLRRDVGSGSNVQDLELQMYQMLFLFLFHLLSSL